MKFGLFCEVNTINTCAVQHNGICYTFEVILVYALCIKKITDTFVSQKRSLFEVNDGDFKCTYCLRK